MSSINTAILEKFRGLYGPYFTVLEFRCKCNRCQEADETRWFITPEFRAFMGKLIKLRKELGFPFIINSGYRCPDYNDELYVKMGEIPGKHLDGPHTKGAADIAVHHERAYDLIDGASSMGMGLGMHQRGPYAGRYIHLDNQGKRPWTY